MNALYLENPKKIAAKEYRLTIKMRYFCSLNIQSKVNINKVKTY